MASCATSAKWRIAIVIIQVSLLVVAIGAGIGLGIGVPLTEPFRDAARRSRFLRLLHTPAEVVLRLVGLFFIPLAFASAVSGLGALPWKRYTTFMEDEWESNGSDRGQVGSSVIQLFYRLQHSS